MCCIRSQWWGTARPHLPQGRLAALNLPPASLLLGAPSLHVSHAFLDRAYIQRPAAAGLAIGGADPQPLV